MWNAFQLQRSTFFRVYSLNQENWTVLFVCVFVLTLFSLFDSSINKINCIRHRSVNFIAFIIIIVYVHLENCFLYNFSIYSKFQEIFIWELVLKHIWNIYKLFQTEKQNLGDDCSYEIRMDFSYNIIFSAHPSRVISLKNMATKIETEVSIFFFWNFSGARDLNLCTIRALTKIPVTLKRGEISNFIIH